VLLAIFNLSLIKQEQKKITLEQFVRENQTLTKGKSTPEVMKLMRDMNH